VQRTEIQNDWLWKRLTAFLVQNGLRQTDQRRDIVTALIKMNQKHVDAEKLHLAVNSLGLEIGLATIYRTLGLLKEAGIVEQHTFSDGRAVFELIYPNEHHDHLICIECGVIREFENQELERMKEKIADSLGFRLSSHNLELYGHCLQTNCPNRA
jgi:Fur family ferric uptake transcriptional regulator